MKLTEKQENFALEYVLNGGNATAAYRKCYDVGENTLETTIWKNAHLALNIAKVSVRIDEFRKQKYSSKVMSVEERKVKLSEWIEGGDSKALDMLNKMEGIYIEKKQLEHSGVDGNPIKTENKWTIEFVEAEDVKAPDTK